MNGEEQGNTFRETLQQNSHHHKPQPKPQVQQQTGSRRGRRRTSEKKTHTMFYEDLNTYYESQTKNRRPLPSSLQGYVIGFSLLSFSFFLVTLSILHCIRYCPVFYDWYGIRIIMPSVTIFLCVLNATIAYDYSSPFDPINYYWGAIVYTLSSAVAPGKSILKS